MSNSQTDSRRAAPRALPWTEVPLFAPAMAVLASAAVAVSALALLTPAATSVKDQAAKEPAVAITLDIPAMAPEMPAMAVEPPAMAADVAVQLYAMLPAQPKPALGAPAKPDIAAKAPSSQRAKMAPAGNEEQFRHAKATLENASFRTWHNILSKKFVEVSFEMPGELTAKAAVPAIFNASIGGGGFLPAPTKPRLLDDSIASAAIKLPVPKPAAQSPRAGKSPRAGAAGSVAALDAHFERIDYDLANVRNSQNNVPRLYLDKLPADIADVSSVTTRKRIFIKAILPVVLRVNEDILAARKKLKELRAILDGGMSLSVEQRRWLYQMAERYETDPYDWEAFMARVDIVPPSLAIAQGAEESGWGTSRFAREGNALFGQYTYKSANGILPEERANGRRHLIRAYSSLVEGVRSYMHNLNYHRAYGKFRAARKWLRTHAKPMDGHTLAGELIRYSERGAAYVKTIRRIIRANKLSPLDDARLHDERWTQDDPTAPGGKAPGRKS